MTAVSVMRPKAVPLAAAPAPFQKKPGSSIPLKVFEKVPVLVGPDKWLNLLTRWPKISPLIIRQLDPITLARLTSTSRRFRFIVTQEWRQIKYPNSEIVASKLLKILSKNFIEGELGISQKEFERTTRAPIVDPKRNKLFLMDTLLDELVNPVKDTFTLEECVTAIKIINTAIGKSLSVKAIDFKKYQKNVPPAMKKVTEVLYTSSLQLAGNFILGTNSACIVEPISKDRVIKKDNKDRFSSLNRNVIFFMTTQGYLDPKSLTRLARTSRYQRVIVDRSWKLITNPVCIRFVVERNLDMVMQNLQLEELLKKTTIRFLQKQQGLTFLFTGTVSLFVGQISRNHWKCLIKEISKIILPYLSNIIPFTMEESIVIARCLQSRVGISMMQKMIPFGFTVDKIAYKYFAVPMLT